MILRSGKRMLEFDPKRPNIAVKKKEKKISEADIENTFVSQQFIKDPQINQYNDWFDPTRRRKKRYYNESFSTYTAVKIDVAIEVEILQNIINEEVEKHKKMKGINCFLI